MPGGMTFEDVSGDMRLENRTGVGGRQEIKLNVFPSLRALIANGLLTRLVRELSLIHISEPTRPY